MSYLCVLAPSRKFPLVRLFSWKAIELIWPLGLRFLTHPSPLSIALQVRQEHAARGVCDCQWWSRF